MGGLTSRNVLSHSSRDEPSRPRAGGVAPFRGGGRGGESAPGLPASSWWFVGHLRCSSAYRLIDLCFHLLVVFSLCVCASEAEFPLFIRALVLLD